MHGGLRRKIDDVCLQSKQPLWWVLRDEMRQAQREIFDEEFDRVDAGKYVKELADRSVWGFGPCFGVCGGSLLSAAHTKTPTRQTS